MDMLDFSLNKRKYASRYILIITTNAEELRHTTRLTRSSRVVI